MKNGASIRSGWALVQKRAIEHFGLDPKVFYQDEGLDISRCHDPDYRFEAVPFNRIWNRLAAETGNPAVGLIAARYFLPTTLNVLGMSICASGTLGDAIVRIEKFSRTVHNGCIVSASHGIDRVLITFTRVRNEDGILLATDYGMDCIITALVNQFRQITQEGFSPLEIHLARKTPKSTVLYDETFPCKVKFSQPVDAIVINAADLEIPLPSGLESLARQHDQVAKSYLKQFDKNTLLEKLKQLIIAELTAGQLTIESAARKMALSVRTLQRELMREKTTFRDVTDEVRKHLAAMYLREGGYNLTEISYLLGYTHSSNFSRAFKKWYGTSPANYSKTMLLQPIEGGVD